jgi:hypothetical protein
MKKQIALATTAAALLSTGAYASKARMQALGQDTQRGSYFLNDSRNVFRNAAGVASMNNYMITEWGTQNNAEDSHGGESPEGGIFRNAGSYSYGLYFGSDVGSQDNRRTAATATGYAGSTATFGGFGNTALADRANELDLFFGGDMGVEWGARLSYHRTAEGFATKTSGWGLGLGMNMGDLGAYLNLGLKDESENTPTTGGLMTWEADTAINIGVDYDWNAWTFYAEYDTLGFEYASNPHIAKNTSEQKTITVGAGHVHEVSSTSIVATEVHYKNIKAEDKDGSVTTNGTTELKTNYINLALAYETDATSWLTLRGSIMQRVLMDSAQTTVGSTQTSSTMSDSTDVAAGATLNFGKLKVDGMIGTDAAEGSATRTERATLRLDSLMSRVGVHYWF